MRVDRPGEIGPMARDAAGSCPIRGVRGSRAGGGGFGGFEEPKNGTPHMTWVPEVSLVSFTSWRISP